MAVRDVVQPDLHVGHCMPQEAYLLAVVINVKLLFQSALFLF